MGEVNWPEWMVLRCEPRTDTDGNIRGKKGGNRARREERRLIGEEETFPEKTIKLIDDFPRGMFPQVCLVCAQETRCLDAGQAQ